jgi:hypothetical protein
MVDIYDSYDLVPAFESTIINEAFKPSKGNARDAKKVNKALEKFFMDHPALAAPGIILGVCRYMMAESLTDANFHSYRDPVSKVIKGKITTVMVELDSLGGMSVPVGKKSIIDLLDDKGAFMANAAGWSGIGIVEGMALFLDGFGHGDTAQKIADAFELIWANESVMNEGNAFLAARAKAIEEDAEEFEFNGKNFPVIKEEVKEVEETEETTDEMHDEEVEEVTEAEVKSDGDFKEYAFAVLGKAFGDDFDEEKAQEIVDGLLSKHGEDYGAAIGALTSSLG